MATERDLSALLPPPPPPRSDRREATIAAAVRRFDGDVSPARNPAPARRWRLTGRPQLSMLAAAALVAAIGLPLWLSDEHRQPVQTHPPAAVAPSAPARSAPPADMAAEPPPDTLARRAPGIVAAPASQAAEPAPPAEQPLREAAEGARTASPPAMVAAPASPPPPAPAMAAPDEANIAGDLVVTGARISNRAAKARQRIERLLATNGDWNACTIDDPRQSLSACRKALPTAAPGTTGRAAALVGDGLTRAWRDDLDGAIAAFDRAIAMSPKLASAWLNRGLSHAKAGDDIRALADLDEAVRYAPDDPRGWFQRSVVLRRAGEIARADADAARAAQHDSR